MKVSKSNSGVLASGGAVVASDLDVDTSGISYDTSTDFVGIGTTTPGVKLEVHDTTTSSANTGGALRLSANDGAPMGDSHRLGVLEFTGAEDSSNTQVVGARIEAITDAAWTNVENGCALYFYTTDGDAVQTNVLKIDSNAKSTFNGNIEVNGDIDLTGGDLTLGTAADSADTTIKAADESGTNTAGKKLTISGGLGTGNAVPGAVEINVGTPGGSGSSVQSATLAIKATAEGTSTYFGGIAGLANDAGVGDIAVFGTEDGTDTLAAGRLMCMNSSGVWKYADADAEATTNGLLAIALGTAVSDGLLLRGFFKLNSYVEGSFSSGQPVYVSEASGEIDFTRPSAAGQFVRVLGHASSESGVIWFSPSGDWLAL